MRRPREFSERLGDLPADLGTGHGAVLPASPPALVMPRGVPAHAVSPPGAVLRARFLPYSFQTIAGARLYLRENPRRIYLLLQNNSGSALWVGYGAASGLNQGVRVANGGNHELDRVVPINSIYVWAPTAGLPFTLMEG